MWKYNSRLARQAKKSVRFRANIEHMLARKKCDNQHQKGANFSKQLH